MKIDDIKRLSLALTSKERLEVYREYNRKIPTSKENIEKWMQINSLIRKEHLEERLRVEGVTKDEFNYSIKELNDKDYDDIYHELEQMEWYKYFIKIMDHFTRQSMVDAMDMAKVTSAFHPFTAYVKMEIENMFVRLNHIVIPIELVDSLVNEFKVKLMRIFMKTITWDITVDREEGILVGKTSDERFSYYMKKHFSTIESIWNYYLRYPTLTRMAVMRTIYFIQFIEEAFSRLDNDYLEISRIFKNMKSNRIEGIKCDAGDSHQKGRSIIIFTFADNKKIVYKPRNLKITQKYNEFISWLNENGKLLDLSINKGIYKEEYAFEEFVTYEGCTKQEEVDNFYKRFGQIIAVAYILCGNDFHFENMIAHGEYPVLIDLETLIQPIVSKNLYDIATVAVKEKQNNETIMGTALMPIIAFEQDGKGVDVSAINAKKQKLPYKILIPSNINTDKMKYEFNEYIFEGANNLPKLNEQLCDFKESTPFIIEGFHDMMAFFCQQKDYLLSTKSILNRFSGILVRNVIKSTTHYGSLLDYSTHPNYSEDMLKREKMLENMWAYPYNNKEVISCEFTDMLFHDIPIFFSYTSERDIISSNGIRVKKFFEQTGIERVNERIRALSFETINEQESYMMVSFGKYKLEQTRTESLRQKESVDFEFDLLKEAEYIANLLEEKAVYSRTGKEISWIDVTKNSNGDWEISAIGPNLYNGTAGIAFFFFELHKVTKKQKYFELYVKAMRTAISDTNSDNSISSYTGKISLMYPILNEYAFTGESEFIYLVEEIWGIININKEKIISLDWISGTAGIIALLLSAYHILEQNKYLILASSLGKILINQISNMDKEVLGVGMAHGYSGVALSLIRLGKETFNQKFIDVAYSLWEREKILINKSSYEEDFKWCNGLTGVLSAKTQLLERENNKYFFKDILESEESITGGIKNNDCLCHGNMGDLEFLISLNQIVGQNLYDSKIKAKLNEIYQRKEENKEYQVRSIPGFTSIDLFTGIGGIGYGILRAYAPEIISNVSSLDICKRTIMEECE